MSEIKVDTVAEKTSANGVTVDGLNIKDSKLVTANSVITSNITDDAVTLAKMASGTDGNIISYDASGNPVAIATGNDGQVLTSTGAGSPPAFEALPSSGITQADQWRLTANIAGQSGSTDITSNLSQVSGAVVGTGMSQSSGIFTFPSTGVYLVFVRLYFSFIENNDNTFIGVDITTDNSSYSQIDRLGHSQRGASAADGTTSVGYTFVDVTNTSNVKIKFVAESQSGGTTFAGSSSENQTTFSFIRLGDT